MTTDNTSWIPSYNPNFSFSSEGKIAIENALVRYVNTSKYPEVHSWINGSWVNIADVYLYTIDGHHNITNVSFEKFTPEQVEITGYWNRSGEDYAVKGNVVVEEGNPLVMFNISHNIVDFMASLNRDYRFAYINGDTLIDSATNISGWQNGSYTDMWSVLFNASGNHIVPVLSSHCFLDANVSSSGITHVRRNRGGQYFDGVNDYIDCGSDSSLDITDAITIEAWMKAHSEPANYGTIAVKGHNADAYRLYVKSGRVVNLKVNTDGTDVDLTTLNTLTLNTWYHIVGVYSKSDSKSEIYLNGNLDNSGGGSGNIVTNTENMNIGRYPSGTLYFNGFINSVSIYKDQALSPSAIRKLYEGTKKPTDFSSCVLYHKYYDNDLTDHSGNGNDGTNHGSLAIKPNRWFGIGAIPFTGTEYLLSEGQTYNYSGATTGTLSGAVPSGTTNVAILDAQHECVNRSFVQSDNTLPLGRYKIITRTNDSNQITNDLRIWVRNITDGTDILNTTTTATATLSYHEEEFTLASDDAGDSINIRVAKAQTDANTINVDYVVVIPVSLDNAMGVEDVCYRALVDNNPKLKVVGRD